MTETVEATPFCWKEALTAYVTEYGDRPKTAAALARHGERETPEFFKSYGSLRALEKATWAEFGRRTRMILEADETYGEYSGREKLLAFWFTLFSEFGRERAFAAAYESLLRAPALGMPRVLEGLKEEILEWAEPVIETALEDGELVERPMVTKYYARGLVFPTYCLLLFWLDDESAQCQNTDQAIEKTVHALFDCGGKNLFDSWLDLGKFVVQQGRR
ncbi:hypothetical protein [Acanthopleuribacter pedis]|uniref:Tetracyclin repressor-like C-terminal domain-containing protein n=1 Tax=Acanthopleuribacter pedis TaxID=442870 RepID=A0A8J7QI97_9BACT|nr:hypothetical protein [Acanthopleuribacter pedis]MBO1321191.1 hypothetical protein [Acanthopleuribacter pedis]